MLNSKCDQHNNKDRQNEGKKSLVEAANTGPTLNSLLKHHHHFAMVQGGGLPPPTHNSLLLILFFILLCGKALEISVSFKYALDFPDIEQGSITLELPFDFQVIYIQDKRGRSYNIHTHSLLAAPRFQDLIGASCLWHEGHIAEVSTLLAACTEQDPQDALNGCTALMCSAAQVHIKVARAFMSAEAQESEKVV